MVRISRCPTCGSRRIKLVRRDWQDSAAGETYTVRGLEFHECPDCGEKLYSPEAMRKIEAVSPACKSRLRVRRKAG